MLAGRGIAGKRARVRGGLKSEDGMDDINLGKTIVRLRKGAGLTQADLAAHLGVTKAAVSKWELGQSLPDMAQVPRIASFFSVTIDELFDYRPQMSEDRMKELLLQLSNLLADDPEAVIERCRRCIKDHYSCWLLVVRLSHLMYMAAVRANPIEPDRAVIDEVIGYFEHVIAHCDDVEIVRSAQYVVAGTAMAQGRFEEAVERFESLRPAHPLEIESSLALAYQMLGDVEKAVEINQEHLFWSVSGALNSCTALLSLCGNDTARLEALVDAARGVIASFGLSQMSPAYELSLFFNAATAYKKIGDLDKAYEHLSLFAKKAARADDLFAIDRDPGILFDRLDHIFRPEADDADRAYFENTTAEIGKLGLTQMLSSEPAWADAVGDPRYRAILAKLGTS